MNEIEEAISEIGDELINNLKDYLIKKYENIKKESEDIKESQGSYSN